MNKEHIIELLKVKTYLGDGLYAQLEGEYIILSTERENGIHWVGLEAEVLKSFTDYVSRIGKLTELLNE